jgi:hypothetical protein
MPLLKFLEYLFIEIFLLVLWTKFLFSNSLISEDYKKKSKPFEIKLTKDNYPFEEGESVNWYDTYN